ncbi:YcnI family protein [Aquihabitans sp. McL0605]|uniref:YcnI family protein n=1 Tax=Aquihabitans sp. McL0605 TaxID=3415671 RepID=UPI003CFA8C56
MPRFQTRTARIVAAGATVAAVSWMGMSAASAHVEPVVEEVPAGAYTATELRVPHGCDGSPTVKVEVQIPASVLAASPFWISGWTASAEETKLDTPVDDGDGGQITEKTSVITWTAKDGSALPDHQVLDFGISYQAPDKVGEVLYFKTIQTCEQGTSEWITEWDGKGEEPEKPAPHVTVVAASGDEHGAEAAVGEEGSTTTVVASDSSSASSSDDGDSSNALAIVALAVGAVGIGLGGAAFAKTRKA